ncbi:uncharacterized protein DUF4956 [Natranaerovirga hydrolytica]|uniref:Uncharacterized protein DUF4956 n=1 Tax=Natranaerovirga hydrolytica TaxID=680378 RepID=A0A4R1MPY8_9FIRM|nr:DUF4956 domain-containing protein [Natranaerovirga hydrolytica]TCK93404.1 uncharacterized protein DUF4956 [Natranaerovirga hydrolytica]
MQAINEIFKFNDIATKATISEVVITMAVSFMLSLIISFVYKKTYKGQYYSQDFVHTLVIIGVVISIIIVAIGSNIARAFSLAGALSIIRFRSSITNPRDIAFIFFVMGAGLATGAGLLVPAIVFAFILSFLIYILYLTNYGVKEDKYKTLKITIPENLNYEGLFDEVFESYHLDYKLLSVSTVSLGTLFELVYSVRTTEGVNDKEIIDDIRAINGNLNVSLILDAQTFE